MKAFILAAGLGTRLKPWTDSHPKALVPVGGIPMLERVVEKLCSHGMENITVNVHHFADQVRDFISKKGWRLHISDESPLLLETGGALLHASQFLKSDSEPILIHNVDILSNADFKALEQAHHDRNADITLLVSPRESSRKLIFDNQWRLKGWHSLAKDEFRPAGFNPSSSDFELAFSGIYIVSPSVLDFMVKEGWSGRFSIMDLMLDSIHKLRIFGLNQSDLELIDIGKPDALHRAEILFHN